MVEIDMGIPLEKVNEFSLKELLGMAIKAEIGAREFYKSMAANVDIETLRKKLEFLAGEEEKHEEFLRKLYAQSFPGEEIVFPKEHVGPELKPVAEKIKNVQDMLELIRWAMEAERIAKEFYSKLEEMTDDNAKKGLLRYLASMENTHYFILKTEYELLLDWEMYSQMMHVGP
ncbi:ferritin family protein [Thermococcus alcaliphilus]|uniref:ferritin family protein n=1 Tax=Thermococcus alcaliphilus TaxID=139207 RepID=UPI00209099DE|nr:ferritin family protein [Thermococcus alcaliphilus]MCO6042110.1 rubrerythrin [Thermococcus alcaliphilus]